MFHPLFSIAGFLNFFSFSSTLENVAIFSKLCPYTILMLQTYCTTIFITFCTVYKSVLYTCRVRLVRPIRANFNPLGKVCHFATKENVYFIGIMICISFSRWAWNREMICIRSHGLKTAMTQKVNPGHSTPSQALLVLHQKGWAQTCI